MKKNWFKKAFAQIAIPIAMVVVLVGAITFGVYSATKGDVFKNLNG